MNWVAVSVKVGVKVTVWWPTEEEQVMMFDQNWHDKIGWLTGQSANSQWHLKATTNQQRSEIQLQSGSFLVS